MTSSYGGRCPHSNSLYDGRQQCEGSRGRLRRNSHTAINEVIMVREIFRLLSRVGPPGPSGEGKR